MHRTLIVSFLPLRALNACADVPRDSSGRGVIALLNEHGCRALQKVIGNEP